MIQRDRLVDTHCHLNHRAFDPILADVLARAHTAGVGTIVVPGYDLPSSRRAVELAAQHPCLYATVGVHPHDAKDLDDAALAELRRLATHPRVVGIGEIGLDYYRNLSPRPVQQAAFRAQLALAGELGLPVVVHDRDAHDDVLAALEEWARDRPADRPCGVLHCFSGDRAMAERCLACGFLISFAGTLTYPKSDRLAEVARHIPTEGFVVETDAPYLAPQPMRGRQNEPANVRAVAERLAALRGESLGAIIAQTSRNAARLFRFV